MNSTLRSKQKQSTIYIYIYIARWYALRTDNTHTKTNSYTTRISNCFYMLSQVIWRTASRLKVITASLAINSDKHRPISQSLCVCVCVCVCVSRCVRVCVCVCARVKQPLLSTSLFMFLHMPADICACRWRHAHYRIIHISPSMCGAVLPARVCYLMTELYL